ncbi:hypothetical protein DPEC_G00294490 [Dallia pectoralis]|uniref:Uncharacterized protein n=1 Tax=Dallia pectoralis TaxID=75939 RepID=A0ACC2FIQ8_DALPE|nr:hypothetical protein DPEC_G00294490 [Dallia pectoralis]
MIYPNSDIAKRMPVVGRRQNRISFNFIPSVGVSTDHPPFFSVASNASNHGTTKLFPMSVCYWTPDLGVQTKVLGFDDDSDETSAAIHNQITKLEENGLGLDMISTAKHGGDRLNIDIENVVNKTFGHFSSSAERIEFEELKSIHTFVEIEYQSLLRHVPTRWQSLWPAVKRLHDSWASIKTYFLSLREDQCPNSLWRLFKDDQDGEGNPLDLQVYLSFLSNAVLVLEREDGTVYRQLCSERTCATSTSPLTDLEQRYHFSDSNYQKKVASLALKKSPFNFSQLCEAVEVLQLSKKLDMDALYDEYCVVLSHQQAIVQSGAPVVENGEGLFTDDRMLSCLVNLINPEIQVKSNFTFSCKDFYTYVVKEKVLLNAERSNMKYKFKKKPEGVMKTCEPVERRANEDHQRKMKKREQEK